MLAKNGSAFSGLVRRQQYSLALGSRGGSTPIVQELIRLGTNVNALNDDQEPPLFWATTNGTESNGLVA